MIETILSYCAQHRPSWTFSEADIAEIQFWLKADKYQLLQNLGLPLGLLD